jgi:PPOX class probable F420-dependent enzyme
MLDSSSQQGAHAEERLRRDPIIWLTTVNGAGQPQSSPVWFLWDGTSFLHYSRPENQKVRNIARNPRVSLHLNDNGVGGDIVTIEATAELAADAPPAVANAPYVEKYREGISHIGMTPESFAAAYSQAIRVTPIRARVW